MDSTELAERVSRVACVLQNAAIALYKGERQEFDRLWAQVLRELDEVQDYKSSRSE
jgi:hypothetical protein